MQTNEVPDWGVEVSLKDPESFLLVKETLTRLGVASNKTKTLYQSCHILHKRGAYFITHFKEMFQLDGKFSDISKDDYDRRNLIVKLLQDWGLVVVVEVSKLESLAPMSAVKILSFKDKNEWALVPKYTIGNKGEVNGNR